MNWFDEKDIENQLRELPKFKLTNSSSDQMGMSLRDTMRASTKARRKRTKTLSVLAGLTGIAVAGVIVANLPIHHSTAPVVHETTGSSVPSNFPAAGTINSTTPTASDRQFDYSKFLPFTPLLPSVTLGLKSLHGGAINIKNATMGLTPGHSAVFTTRYAGSNNKWFTVAEEHTSESTPSIPGNPSEDKTVQKNGIHFLVSPVMKNNSISYFWIAFVQNQVKYDISFSDKISSSEALTIATHFNVPDDQKPYGISMYTNSVTEAEKAIDFQPVIPKTTLRGYHQTVITSNTDFNSNTQQFGIEYDSTTTGKPNLIVTQLTGKNSWAKQIFTKSKEVSIDGQTAYFVNTSETGSCLMWIDPKSSVLFEITDGSQSQKDLNLSQQLATKFINAAKPNAIE